MASLFWVGGAGTYDGVTNHFATSTGGPATVAAVTSADDVTFDSLSGSGSVTIAAVFACNTLTLAAANITLACDATHGITVTGTLTFGQGTLNTNGQTCQWGAFNGATSTARTLTLGSSPITITGTSSTAWNLGTNTNLVVTTNTAVVTLTGAGAGISLNNQNMNGTSFVLNGGGTVTVASANATVANLTVVTTTVKTDAVNFSSGGITVTGTLALTGNSVTNRLMAMHGVPGTPSFVAYPITAAAVALTNTDFMDITALGAAAPWAGTSLGDCLGNTGITFTVAVPQAWQGTTGGSWSDVTKWTSRVPLPQDDVSFGNAFAASQTITIDMPRIGRTVSFVGTTGNPTLSYGTGIAGRMDMYGSFDLTGLGSVVATNVARFGFCGRSSLTLTTGGVILPGGAGTDPALQCLGGTYVLQDDLRWSCAVANNFGTFDANGRNVQVFGWGCNPAVGGGGILMGNGTWTLTGSPGAIWNVNTNASIQAQGSTIILSSTSASAITFAGGNHTYNVVRRTAAGAGGVTITGNNTFAILDLECTTARTITLPAGGRQTVTGGILTLRGTRAQQLSMVSSTPGTQTTVIVATGSFYNLDQYSLSSDVNLVLPATPDTQGHPVSRFNR